MAKYLTTDNLGTIKQLIEDTLLPSGALAFTRLTEGTDYTFTQGPIGETVTGPDDEQAAWFWGQTTIKPETPTGVFWANALSINYNEQLYNKENFGRLTDPFFVFHYQDDQGAHSYISTPLTIAGIDNIYWPDTETVRAVKVTGTVDIHGVGLQFELCQGYNFNDGWDTEPNMVYVKVTVTSLDFTDGVTELTLSAVRWIMPGMTEQIPGGEYFGLLELSDPFALPETMLIHYKAAYDRAGTEVTGEATAGHILPESVSASPVKLITDALPGELNFTESIDLAALLSTQATVIARGQNVAVLLPNEAENGETLTGIEFLDVYKLH